MVSRFSDLMIFNRCNFGEMISETSRFAIHIFFVHVLSYFIKNNSPLFNEEFYQSMVITVVAIMIYHIFIKKIYEPKLEKIKIFCLPEDKINHTIDEINKKDLLKSNRISHLSKYYNRLMSY